MYSRLYNFLTIHNCIYDLRFGFRKNHSVNHALTSLTEGVLSMITVLQVVYSSTCRRHLIQ